MIEKLPFARILPVWETDLWPNRTSRIEPNSAKVLGCTGKYDMASMSTPPTFVAYTQFGIIAGVNSGHKCSDNTYRSRGLFVYPAYRHRGVAQELLQAIIKQAKLENTIGIWSYPTIESWETYKAVGFTLVSEWERSETGIRAYCYSQFNI
jgi:GNAT superfamily N-acetyltransferase